MSNPNEWHKHNEEYLAAALDWLRLRLGKLARRNDPFFATSSNTAKPKERSWIESLWGQSSSVLDPPAEAPPSTPIPEVTDEQIEEATSKLEVARRAEPSPALIVLSQRLGLTSFERNILLLCAAVELDTRIAWLCARAQADLNKTYPTFALAMALFDDPAWDVLSPERPLRYLQLIEMSPAGNWPLALTTSPLRADERIVNYIKGLNYLDDRLASLLTPLKMESELSALPPSQQAVVDVIVGQLVKSGGEPLPVIQLVGLDGPSKQLVADHVAFHLGLNLYRISAELLPNQLGELETLARLWERENFLLPVALYLDAFEAQRTAPAEDSGLMIGRFFERSNGIFFLGTREVWPGLGRKSASFDVDKPTPEEQRDAWKDALGPGAGNSPKMLAGQFNLNLETIYQIALAALLEVPDDGPRLHDRVWEMCLANTRPRLDVLAQRIESKATWDDIVLPEAEKDLLTEIANQVRQRSRVYDDWGFRQKMNRGLGISALFAGESGTGKTMAAEVIANKLGLDLYRIDLSAVVSKYIGETEKNLRRVFDAAEDGGAILFFDEADAIFGKRAEVKDSHDRYANIEVSYLLQRMEAFRGLAILTTNMKTSLDQAFLRRLRFIVNFPFPGAAERKKIWEKSFPYDTPKENLDFDRLAKFSITGGSIHNIALNAAFLAAQDEKPVTMPLVLKAARTEFRKLEKPINEADFRWENES